MVPLVKFRSPRFVMVCLRKWQKRTLGASLGAGGGVNSVGGREAFEGPELVEGLNKFLGVGEDGDEVGLRTGAGSLAGFELAVEDEGGIGLW
jgi:hypothetical protein